MRYIAQCSLIALALAWVSPAAAGELEFHGYTRLGIGLAATGGPGLCFGLGNAPAKFRLGNECDYVVEFIFNQHIAKLDDGSDWGIGIMPAGGGRWQSDPNGFNLGLNQVYVYGSNVPQLANGMIWAGRKYYARLQTGINDMFIQNASSTWYGEDGNGGEGAGVEDMKLGPAKVSAALIINPSTDPAAADATVKPFKLEAHAFIPTVEKGELSIYALMVNRSKTVNESLGEDPPDVFAGPNQYNLGVYHKLGGVLNGDLFVGAKIITSSLSQTWRVLLQQGMGFPDFQTNVDFLTVYQSSKARPTADADWGDATNWFSVGARTDTHISGPFRFLLEYGYDRVASANEADINDSLNKLTGVLAVSAGPDPWSRPTVRLYYTQAWWNEGAGPGTNAVYSSYHSGNLVRNAYGNQTAGGSFGIQGEVWW